MELRCRMNAEAGVFSIILQPGVMLDFQKLGITERMPGLAPCRVAIREELRFLEYYVSGCRPLAERLKEPMSKEVFLNLGRQLAASGAALESAGISQELSVEPETVFLSEKGALFCYIPIEGYRGGSFRRLFQQILARSSFREGEDAFVQALHQYLQNHAALSLREPAARKRPVRRRKPAVRKRSVRRRKRGAPRRRRFWSIPKPARGFLWNSPFCALGKRGTMWITALRAIRL